MTTLNPKSRSGGQLLDELARAPVESRAPMLRAWGPVEPALSALIDHAAQLTGVDASKAMDATDIVVNLADRVGSQLDRARARRVRARALSYGGRFEDALATAREGARLAEEAGHAIEAGRARLASMHALGEMGRLDEAIRVGEAARQSFVSAGEHALAARADINLGTAHQRRDELTAAVQCFERAKPLLANEPLIIGHLENNRGEALLGLNDFAGAETAFRSALLAFQNASTSLTAAIAEGNLADLAARQGHLQDALLHFERARRHFEMDGATSHLARLLAEQAEALSVLGMPREALVQYETSLTMLDSCGLALEAARARCGMGKTLIRLNLRTQAETALAAAAAAFAELGHATQRARVDLVRAQLAMANGRATEARAMVWRAMSVLHDRPADLIAARFLLGTLAANGGRLDEALADFNAGLTLARELDLAPLQTDLLFARGKLYRSQGKLNRAIDDFTAAVQQVERARGSLQAERFRAAFLGDRATLYEALVSALLDTGSASSMAAAWNVIEQAKSRSLLERLQGLLDERVGDQRASSEIGQSPGEEALLIALERARAELNGLYSRLADERAPAADESGTTWRDAVRQRESELDALELRLTSTRGVGGLYTRIADLESVQKSLDSQTAMIEYFIAGDELLALVIDSDGIQAFRRLAEAPNVLLAMQRVQFQMNRALRPAAMSGLRGARLVADSQRELAALGKLVLDPIRPLLQRCTKLVMIPHGPLHVLPFHALWDGRQYLLETHEIRCAPSASLFLQLGRRSAGEVDHSIADALVVGVDDGQAPQIAHEARQVAASLGCSEQHVLIGARATAKRVTAAAREAAVIHLACHGRFNADAPLSSGLRMTDRWLTVRDLFAMRLSAELVTLSGCETGLSLVNAGDELMGLLRGFFAAGAASMLVSLWRVDDQSTTEFMSAFYEQCFGRSGKRLPIGAGLRETQRAFLATRHHPAFWAPFMLVGGVEPTCDRSLLQ